MSIISFVKGLFHEPILPPAIGLALTEQPAQTNVSQGTTTSQEVTNASQEAQLKGNTNMNFILFSSNVASLIQAVEAMATVYEAKSGQTIPGADKLKSVVALVESAGASVLAFIPSLEPLVKTLVQQYNDSGLFVKKAAA